MAIYLAQQREPLGVDLPLAFQFTLWDFSGPGNFCPPCLEDRNLPGRSVI